MSESASHVLHASEGPVFAGVATGLQGSGRSVEEWAVLERALIAAERDLRVVRGELDACRRSYERAAATAVANKANYGRLEAEKAQDHAKQIVALTREVDLARRERDQAMRERDESRAIVKRLFTNRGNFRTSQAREVVTGALRSLIRDHPDFGAIQAPGMFDSVVKRIVGQLESWVKGE